MTAQVATSSKMPERPPRRAKRSYRESALWTMVVVSLLVLFVFSALGAEPEDVKTLTYCLVPAIFVVGVVVHNMRSRAGRSMDSIGAATLLFVLTAASVPMLNWPLRLSSAISRPMIEEISRRNPGVSKNNCREQAGFFVIRKTEIRPSEGIPLAYGCYWIKTDAAGRVGFVTCSSDQLPKTVKSHVWLGKYWHFVVER